MKARKHQRDLDYVGRIHESLHGFIHLTQVEKDLINCPYLQRLRYIKQLGLVNLVFPGGEHTRFSHSLGVMWVIDRISRHLRFDTTTRQTLRLAALLHDVGHFPLSHTLEAAYEDIEKEMMSRTAALLVDKTKTPGRRKSAGRLLSGDAALHERMSRHIIQETNSSGGVTHILKAHKFEPNVIGSVVVGESNIMLYNQLMHSDIDADQMDYLIRDATSLGVEYGQFAIEYLIECFKTKKFDGQDLLCIKEKGIHTVDHYLLAKYFYYVQILYHRTRWIIEEAAKKLYSNLLVLNKTQIIHRLEDLPSIAKDKRQWSTFDDAWVMTIFRQAELEKWLPRECHCLYDIILRRRIPDCKFEKTMNHPKAGPKDSIELYNQDMERAVKSDGKGLSATRVNLHHLTKGFNVVKTVDERITQKGHKDKSTALREDRDIIRILVGEKEKVVPIGEETASLAQYLQTIETHVFRAYKLKTT